MTMEVSSQALECRAGCGSFSFQVGIFLNISRDHISPKEHVDFEDYFSSKLSLFRQTEVACVNLNAGLCGPDFKGGAQGRAYCHLWHEKARGYPLQRNSDGGTALKLPCHL